MSETNGEAQVPQENNESTAVSIDLNNLNADSIPTLIEKVNEEIAKIKEGQGGGYQTAGKKLFNYGEVSKIETVATIVRAFASVNVAEARFLEAREQLEISAKQCPYKLDGKSANQWREDLKMHLQIVTTKDRLAKLQKAKSLLEANLSKEQKLKNDLGKIAELFS